MLYKIYKEEDENKIEKFLSNENIKFEKYFSWYDNFGIDEARIQLNEIEGERFKKLTENIKKNV